MLPYIPLILLIYRESCCIWHVFSRSFGVVTYFINDVGQRPLLIYHGSQHFVKGFIDLLTNVRRSLKRYINPLCKHRRASSPTPHYIFNNLLRNSVAGEALNISIRIPPDTLDFNSNRCDFHQKLKVLPRVHRISPRMLRSQHKSKYFLKHTTDFKQNPFVAN